ncbi:serine/threonine-protein phosphatase 4 regulatory subunit 1-like isoform X3 [Rhodnius prolixus]|uniref:serine/threonine-protein phosphatase 4 regulatory subunit 1-like isoform X3 n=1 Tax=Rhodnius prolixus TaxID=13249 RepID=UPI003D18B637
MCKQTFSNVPAHCINSDSDVVAKDENGRCIDRPEDGPPRLVPASQQTYNQSPVRTAAVTAVSKPSTTVVTDDWSNLDHSYDSADNDRRHLIGRTGLENLRAVAGVPHKAAAFLEQFTAAAYTSGHQVRCEILEYLPHMALLLSEDSSNVQLKSLISSHLLPVVAESLSEQSTQVVKIAESALLTMLEHCLIGAEYIETRIWPVIKARMQHSTNTENTNAVLTVMSKMAPWLGCDQTERLLVPALEQLSAHPEFGVRKVCASLYGDFCAVISTTKTESVLVPSFLRLCADPEFVVRKTCAESFMSVSCTVTLHTRRTQLAPVFARLLSDSTRWVQMAAFQSLGPFITTFAEPSITMLGYNHQGELVLKHPDGFEFRLNSCKLDERYLYTRDALFALVMDGSGNQQQQYSQHQQQESQQNLQLHNNEEEDDWNFTTEEDHQGQQQKCLLQQDDRNNNHDRLSIRHTKEEQTEDNEVSESGRTGSSVTIDRNVDDEAEIYNQFQYWRDPLPDIDSDLNCNEINKATCTTVTISNTISAEDSLWISSNNSNNNNISCSNSSQILNQRLPQSPQQLPQHQQSPYPPPQQAPQPQKAMASLVRRFQDMSVTNKDTTTTHSSSSESSTNSETASNFTTREDERQPSPVPPPPSTPAPPLQEIVPLELIRHFVSMSEPGRDAEDLAGHCAYNLPAVALTLGPKHWDLLKPAYETLAADRQWKVRRIVASSIHELAVIVGEEVATQDLVPVFNGFIKDLDEVRIAALKHLAHFLKLLRPAGRNSFLPRLTEFLMTDYEWNWRFRQELAQQLLQVLGLFSPVDTCHHLSPVVMALLVDRVSDVRKVALQLATELVSHVSIDVTLLRSLLAELAEQFAHSSRWNRRQTFALFCSRLVSEGVLSGEMFARDVLPHLLDLSWDRVPNVRLTVARALANDVIVQPYFSDYSSPHYEVLHSVLKRLQGDRDRDVRYFASQVPVMPNAYSLSPDLQVRSDYN